MINRVLPAEHRRRRLIVALAVSSVVLVGLCVRASVDDHDPRGEQASATARAAVMKQATRHGLPRKALMRFMLKLMANLTDPRDGDASDRVINALSKAAPTA